MKHFKRLTAAILGLIFMSGILPAQYVSADNTLHTLSDGSVSVTVSGENGGFAIRTEEGDKLIKSDNNEELLFHRDAYDTSFTSFQVTEQGGAVKEYLFGGSYGFMGLSSSEVHTTKDPAGITSEWSVDHLTFTQRIELAGEGAAEHGMVLITYKVTSSDSTPVQVRARLLMDTALGEQDYAYYEVSDQYGEYRSIERETVISDYIPANFFGYDTVLSPEITAYTVNTTKPYEIAFAHWNNLASALFDFTPDTALNFTNPYNPDYLTADSAVGLYYDLGTVSAAEEGNLTACYGVYSNQKVTGEDSIAINAAAPDAMTLSEDRKTYESQVEGLGDGTFSVQAQINNFLSDTAKVYPNVSLAAYVPNGIEPLDENGAALGTSPSYLNPYTVEYRDFQIGQTQSTRFLFKATVGDITEFRKIELRAFDTENWDGGALTSDRIIGSRTIYILCPGGDGKLPEILFTGMKPEIIYNKGQRNLYISGKNFNLLEDKSQYVLRAYNQSDSSVVYDIPSEQISFSDGADGNILNIALSEEMKTGSFELVFDWKGEPPTGLNKKMSAPALQLVVSDDKQYQNDYYGILAVVQNGNGGGSTYEVCMYRTENEFKQDAKNHTEVLLVFKGGFEKTKESGNDVYKATSVKSSGGKAEDTIVINDCIDFENGNVTVSRKNSSVLVDFDGDLYTSVKRSKIWSGKATFTALDDGVEYGLVPYNSDGERMEGEHGQEITLLWPCGLSLAQTISGMAFNMTFGSLGIVYDTNTVKLNTIDLNTPVKGRVISFSACLDLSFLVPKAGYSARDNNWASIEMAFSSGSLSAGDLRDRWKGVDMLNHRYNGTSYMDKRAKEGQGSVMVQDILYGCGEGLLGVNFDVNLVLPGYFDAMPSLAGHLAVNTIGGYEIGVDGSCQFATLELDTSIRLKDHNGIPIPDKLYFYIAGFEPGINVDGFGVLWITGGGGGIDKLYDTIFAGSSVPPLKILLSVSFDILKTLSSRVDLSLSLRGLGLTARDVKVKYLNVPVLDKLALNFEWYPDFYFQASVDANILSVIRGQGYIVIMNNEQYNSFVEFFIRARVKIPDDILIVGGMELGGIDLGANNEKIWGKVEALSASFGVTYYWGGSVDFGSGSSVTKPSFPSLLGFEDIPVYYDAASDQTLYMRVGTNLSLAAQAQVVSELVSAEPVLLAVDRSLQSDLARTQHKLTLGAHNDTDAAVTIQFKADSRTAAEQSAERIVIENKPLVFYHYNEGTQTGNENIANANLVYNEKTQTASVSVVFGEDEDYNQRRTITTPTESDLILYDIAPMPKLQLIDSARDGQNIRIGWSGNRLSELDSVSFMLTADPTGDPTSEAFVLGNISTANEIKSGTISYALPPDLPSGVYYVKAVYTKKDIINEMVIGTNPIAWSNSNQPDAPSAVTAKNGGDYMLDFEVSGVDAEDIDGYLVNIYESDEAGNYILSPVNNVILEKDSNNELPEPEVGGRYSMPVPDENGNETSVEEVGLEAGKTYHVGISNFKNITLTNGEMIRVQSSEVRTSEPVLLRQPQKPNAELTNITNWQTLTRNQQVSDTETKEITVDTFAEKKVEFKVTSDVRVSGKWTLNETLTGTFDTGNTGDTITLTSLEDGDYKLQLSGEDNEGDGFAFVKNFTVDTLPPILMLTSPVNGAFFNQDGSIKFSGISDSDARFDIYVDGTLAADGKTVEELGGTIDSSGLFSFFIPGSAGVGEQTVVISVKDAMQNASNAISAKVYNKGFADVKSLTVYADGNTPQAGNLPMGESGLSATLTLGVNTSNGSFLLQDSSLVDWSVSTVLGNAAVDENGILSASVGSLGTVTGSFHVAETNKEAIASGVIDSSVMKASVAFGAENQPKTENQYIVSLLAGVGGTAEGAGKYTAGEPVTLTATPDNGYRFIGWKVTQGNITLSVPAEQAATFTMPTENVSVTAEFKQINVNSNGSSRSKAIKIEKAGEISANAGELCSFALQQNTNGASYTPYYFENGQKIYVCMSCDIGDKLWFIAPKNAVYYLEQRETSFDDVGGHWAENSIYYSASKSLFSGVSQTEFAPDEIMTRAMLVAVLQRLTGISPLRATTAEFDDVAAKDWYFAPVAWCFENNIITGYGNGLFGPNDAVTREQMCTIILRYLNMSGYALYTTGEAPEFADSNAISDWASEAIGLCQRAGLVQGKEENNFEPQSNLTRAECTAVLQRLIESVIKSKGNL